MRTLLTEPVPVFVGLKKIDIIDSICCQMSILAERLLTSRCSAVAHRLHSSISFGYVMRLFPEVTLEKSNAAGSKSLARFDVEMFPRIRIIDLSSEVAQAVYGLLHPSADWRDSPAAERVITAGFFRADGLDFSLKAWSASKTLSPASLGQHSRHELR